MRQEIAPARLEAVMHAALCIECQARAERTAAPMATPSL
jgi:RNA polymerase-binding transcription factor DksA